MDHRVVYEDNNKAQSGKSKCSHPCGHPEGVKPEHVLISIWGEFTR